VLFKKTIAPTSYPDALAFMEQQVEGIIRKTAPEMLWLLQHPALYTAGTSAKAPDLLNSQGFPVYQTGRGGEYTYHGIGQAVGYVMLDLHRYQQDVRWYICTLEQWLIDTLAVFGVIGERRAGRVGIWVVTPDGTEAKIAAIGVRLRRWVTFHGVSLNVCPNLQHFQGIVPCGIKEFGVTSLAALGVHTSLEEVFSVMEEVFKKIFIPLESALAAMPH
jgi:lipoyl(octanoyl) transferase